MHSKCCPLGEETGKWMSCFHKEFSVFMFDADQKPPCNVAQFKRMTKEMRNNSFPPNCVPELSRYFHLLLFEQCLQMKRDFIADANKRGRGKQSMNVLDSMKGLVFDIVAIDRRQK